MSKYCINNYEGDINIDGLISLLLRSTTTPEINNYLLHGLATTDNDEFERILSIAVAYASNGDRRKPYLFRFLKWLRRAGGRRGGKRK